MGGLTLKQVVQRGFGISTQNSIRHQPMPPAVSWSCFVKRSHPDGIQSLLPNSIIAQF